MTAASGRLFSFVRSVLPPVETQTTRPLDGSLYPYLWCQSRSQQWRLCALAVALLPLSMAPLELQRLLVDEAIADGDVELLLRYAGIYLAVLVAHGLLKYAFKVYQATVGEGVVRALRRRVLAAQPPPAEEDGEGGGSRVALAAAEAEQVGSFAGEAFSFPVLQLGIVVTVLGYMLWLEPLLALVAVVSVIPSIIVTPLIQNRVNRHVHKRVGLVRSLGDRLAAEAEERDAGDERRAHKLVDAAYHRRLRIFVLKFALKASNNFLAAIGPLGILVVGGWLVITSDTQMGTLVAFLSGFERLTAPSRQLINFYRQVSQMRVQYRLMAETLA